MSVKCTIFYDGKYSDIEIEPIGAGFWLQARAAQAFTAMREAALKVGIPLVVNTALRTHEQQKQLRAIYDQALIDWHEGRRKKKPASVAEPGSVHSHHEQGTAVDINRAPGDDLSTPEPDSPIDLWLNKNAKMFGFFRTVSEEPWHWQYLPEQMESRHAQA